MKDKHEFIKAINAYLKDPKLDFSGRKKMVEEQVWRTDGKAGERIADFVYGLIC